jgi:hypothetical protein
MASASIFHQGCDAKQRLEGSVNEADICMQVNGIFEGQDIKRLTKYVAESKNWQLLADVDKVLKAVTGKDENAYLKKGIIVGLALIHNKPVTDLQVKLNALAAFGTAELIEEYKAVLAKARKKEVPDLGIQLTLRNFETGSQVNVEKAVAALKLVLQTLPEVNKRLGRVSTDPTEAAAFKTWFGDPKLTLEKVSANFAAMAEAIQKRHVILSFDGTGCQNTETGGYVYMHKTSDKQLCNIHLCRMTFADGSIPRIAATIMHELSHAAAKTDDVAAHMSYGKYICQNFATTDPQKAASNADNYRWYAFPEVA